MAEKKLLIMDQLPTSGTYKLTHFLKDYFDITFISLSKSKRYDENSYKNLGVDVYSFNFQGQNYWNWKKLFSFSRLNEIFKFLLQIKKIKRKNLDFVLARTEPNYVGLFLFKIFKSSKKIYFPYDISLFRYGGKNRGKLDVFSEKYCFENADFIIHKGPENELDLIKESEIKKIKGKPIHFLPYCLDKWIIPIKKEKDKLRGLHLVYIGGGVGYSKGLRRQSKEIFQLIANQGIKLHVYSLEDEKFRSNPNIIFHGPEENFKLNKAMSKYHYGIIFSFHNKKIVREIFTETAMANKVFSYLEAGIPFIVNEEHEYMSNFIRKYKCGVVVSEKDLDNLKEILKKQNYLKLLENTKKTREKLRLSKQIKKVDILLK